METYLAIITTVLVLTQVIRLVQNTIQLKRQKEQIERNINWITEREVTKEDFDCQRDVMYLLRKWLMEEKV